MASSTGPEFATPTNGSLASAATVLAERTQGGNSSARSNSGRGSSSAEALFFDFIGAAAVPGILVENEASPEAEVWDKTERITGVCYDKNRQVWIGHWHENNKPYRKSFSAAKYGYDGAKRRAIAWRQERERGVPYEQPHRATIDSPKGVCFNEAQRGWRASWCKNGKEHCKYFSVAKHGYEGAKRKAIAWRRDRERGIPIEKPARRTCDEVKGVCYDTLGKRWQASWSQQGRRISKRFPIAEHGAERAKELAIQWRREREAEARLISGCRLRVWWSAEAHSEAGYSDRGIDGAWYDATVTSAGTDTISVRYDVGENKHFVKLAKSLLTASPGIQGIALRVAQSELDAAKRPKQRKQGVKRTRAKRDEKRASISDPQIMVRAHTSVARAREHGSNDLIDGMFVASCVLHPVCCILRIENDVSRSMCMPVPETHRHGRPSLIFFHMMILRLTSK